MTKWASCAADINHDYTARISLITSTERRVPMMKWSCLLKHGIIAGAIGATIGFLYVQQVSGQQASRPAGTTDIKWEYQYSQLPTTTVLARTQLLNELGQLGWEFVPNGEFEVAASRWSLFKRVATN
jgi:hypothetical protein